MLTETLQAAGEQIGLNADLSKKLARQTVIGSGFMLGKTDKGAADLRKAVTSPNGTTEAALKILMDSDGLPQLMRRAVTSAYERSKALGKE